MDLDKLLTNLDPNKGKRYVSRKGKRYKREDWDYLDPNQKAEIVDKELKIFNRVESKLEKLETNWAQEQDPIIKRILVCKYDLLVLKQGFISSDEKKEIEKLEAEIKELESSNKI